MRSHDVSPYEMSRFDDISDTDLEAVLAGRVPGDDERLGDIARFARDLDEAYPLPSTEHCEGAHVAAMLEAAQLVAAKGDPVARPASKADGPVEQASGLPKPRRSRVMKSLLGAPLWAKITASALVVLMSFTGVAVAGVLPDPVQGVVHDAADAVGIDIPDAVDEAAAPVVGEDVDESADVEDEAAVDEDADEATETDVEDADDADDDADEADDDADEAREAETADDDADEATEADDSDDRPATTIRRQPTTTDDDETDEPDSESDESESESESD